jgi:hypothetical protein
VRKNRPKNRKVYKGFTTFKELHSGVLGVCAIERNMEHKQNQVSRFQDVVGFSFSFCLRGDL